MKRRWKRLRYRLEYRALLVVAKVMARFPRTIVLLLARLGSAIAPILDKKGRRVALANLDLAFGNRYSVAEKRSIVRQSYRHFAQTMLDLMWSPRLTRDNFRRYIELEKFPDLNPGEGAIIVCYHYSNFEWLSLACGYIGQTGTILAQEFKNPLLDPIFRYWREQSGHSFIARTGGVIRLYKVLRRGGKTAMLVDLTVPAGTSAVAINCFGLRTSVTAAHAWLQQGSGAALIPAHCEPLPRGRYRIVFHPRIQLGANASLRQIAQACWDSFEPVVRADPSPWLWMYKHWRYRPLSTDRDYPFYASPHHKFEPMLAQD
jgi:KDO2-lipid IV(A) lauroyltransferase